MQIITQLLSVLQGQLSKANLTHFAIIIESILSLSRPVTTSNGPGRSGAISRASNLSYRTIHRFYALKNINWSLINLILFKTFVYQKDKIYLLAADETVEDKAGKSTHGIGRFYASTLRKTIKSISFLAAVIIDIEAEKSHFLACQQILPTPKTLKEGTKTSSKKGRPKGSKNKPKTESTAHSYHCLKNILTLITNGFSCLIPDLKCFHLVLDGFYGHENYLLLALENKLNIISKFKHNAHLILPYKGQYSGKGRPKMKGDKVDLNQIDSTYLLNSVNQHNITTKIYQFKAYTPRITKHLLNIVVLIHRNEITKKESKTILFSSDLSLSGQQIIKYYSLRFQIEFDFRDAKQFYGLSDFKNYKQTMMTNAVNLSFSMTLIGKLILKKYKEELGCQSMGIADLKALFKVEKQAKILFNDNKNALNQFLNSTQFLNIVRLEAIHI